MAGYRLDGQVLFPAGCPELFSPTPSSGPGSNAFSRLADKEFLF
jgi:hypothetical protein